MVARLGRLARAGGRDGAAPALPGQSRARHRGAVAAGHRGDVADDLGHFAMRGVKTVTVAAVLATLARAAHPHAIGPQATAGPIALEIVLFALMVASALGYAIGVARLWR